MPNIDKYICSLICNTLLYCLCLLVLYIETHRGVSFPQTDCHIKRHCAAKYV